MNPIKLSAILIFIFGTIVFNFFLIVLFTYILNFKNPIAINVLLSMFIASIFARGFYIKNMPKIIIKEEKNSAGKPTGRYEIIDKYKFNSSLLKPATANSMR